MRKLLAIFGLLGVLLLGAAPADSAPANIITVTWSEDGKSVTVTSDKDISNVVLRDCAGTNYKHDRLKGHTGTFAHPSGGVIVSAWIKSGSNDSGEGPGYGKRFDNPDTEACETTTTTTKAATTTTTEGTTTTTGASTATTKGTTATTATTATTPVSRTIPTPPAADVLADTETRLPKTGGAVAMPIAGALALPFAGSAMRRRATRRN